MINRSSTITREEYMRLLDRHVYAKGGAEIIVMSLVKKVGGFSIEDDGRKTIAVNSTLPKAARSALIRKMLRSGSTMLLSSEVQNA
jgi:hypothetical protein